MVEAGPWRQRAVVVVVVVKNEGLRGDHTQLFRKDTPLKKIEKGRRDSCIMTKQHTGYIWLTSTPQL